MMRSKGGVHSSRWHRKNRLRRHLNLCGCHWNTSVQFLLRRWPLFCSEEKEWIIWHPLWYKQIFSALCIFQIPMLGRRKRFSLQECHLTEKVIIKVRDCRTLHFWSCLHECKSTVRYFNIVVIDITCLSTLDSVFTLLICPVYSILTTYYNKNIEACIYQRITLKALKWQHLLHYKQTKLNFSKIGLTLSASRGLPKPGEIYNPSSMFWVYPGFSYQLDVPSKPPNEGRRHPYQMPGPPQLAPFDTKEQRPSCWISELLTLPLRLSPATLRRKLISAACVRSISFFWSVPKACYRRWGLRGWIDWKTESFAFMVSSTKSRVAILKSVTSVHT